VQKISYFLLPIITIFLLLGCGRHKHRKPKYHSDKYKTYVATSMSDLDNYSKHTNPKLVYSFPKNFKGSLQLNAIKYRMLSTINSIRSTGNQCGPSARPLGWSVPLEDAARMHARDMSFNNHLTHLGSGTKYDLAKKDDGRGSNFYERILYSGYPVKSGELAGEILTYTKYSITGNKDPLENFDRAVKNFLRSPSHCGILMNNRFKDVGVSAYEDGEKIYWVIEFGESVRR
jgi:uncharacterized protein YkwD